MKASVSSARASWILFFIFCLGSSFVTVEAPLRNNHLSGTYGTEPAAITKPATKKAPLIKRLATGLQQRFKKGSTGLTVLVIVGALVAAALVGFGLFVMAWGGLSEVIVAIVAVVALGLIIWGAVSLIKNIRSRGMSRAKLPFKNRPAFTQAKKKVSSYFSF